MKWTLEKKAILNGGVILVLFVFIGTLQYMTIRSLINSSQWVTHTVEVLQQIESIQFAISNAEDSAKDYLITGDPSVLTSYQSAVQGSKAGLRHLAFLTSDNANEQVRVATLNPLVEAKFAELNQVMALREGGGLADAESQEFGRQGREQTAEISQIILKMKHEEYHLLRLRNGSVRSGRRETVAIVTVGTLFALLVVGWGIFMLHRDLSGRDRAEAALRSSEGRFRAVAETANDAIVSADSEGKILFWNNAAEKIFGYPAPEVIGQPIEMLMPERFRALPRQGYSRFLSTGQGRILGQTLEMAGLRKDGSEFPLELSLATWRAGGLPFFTGLIRDISERKHREETLRELSGRFLRLQDEERRRIARELHDGTSQMLSAMQLHLSILQSGLSPENDAAKASVGELSGLIERCHSEIRTLSHLLHPPLLEYGGLASATRWYVEGFSQRSGIQVEIDFPGDLPRFNLDTETALFRITQEGLANIHRHSGCKNAWIRATLLDGRIRLEISDNGRGIPEDVLRSPAKLGVGIRGMTERVRILGGELAIESEGQGTTVRVELPLEAPVKV